MLKAVLFDLDGTLLPMNEEEFIPLYLDLLATRMESKGYNKEKFISALWSGTKKMYLNNGTKTNGEIFWDEFSSHFGKDSLKDKEYIDEFYTNEFLKTKEACKENKYAKEIVKFVKNSNLLCILSTNPIFPKIATKTRMGFVGLIENDFDYYSYYENSHYTKPNPYYFLEILDKFNLKSDEVILFGNNTFEDGECALKCGIKTYIVDGFVIYHDKSFHSFPVIKMEDVTKIIKNHLNNL